MRPAAILFDLDGTLLPMDQDLFIDTYFAGLAKKLSAVGYEPKAFIDAIWKSLHAMVRNDGSCTNETAFWAVFGGIYGQQVQKDVPVFEDYYRREFQQVKAVCGFNPEAGATISWLKARGYRLILATNPVFPAMAVESRLRWAGVNPANFAWLTTYENATYCKPNPAYYRQILEKEGLQPEQCLMIGNDTADDMVAQQLGMQVFLLTDCLINKRNADLSQYPQGSFSQLRKFIETIERDSSECTM